MEVCVQSTHSVRARPDDVCALHTHLHVSLECTQKEADISQKEAFCIGYVLKLVNAISL